MFRSGDKVFDTSINKYGIVVYLCDDSRETKIREYIPYHYCYYINYDDGTFDSYVFENYLIKSNREIDDVESLSDTLVQLSIYSNYCQKQKVINIRTNQIGTIKHLRNCEYELNQRKNDKLRYYYRVEYDDDGFETFEHGSYLKPI